MDAATLPNDERFPTHSGHARQTPRPGDNPMGRSAHTPSVIAVSERRCADAWKAVAIAVSLASLALAYVTIRAGRATERVCVMDGVGNVYAGPLEPLARSRQFFHVTAIYATNAALQRSPTGFDLPELLKLYYTPRAVARLQDDQKSREPDIRRRNLQWKPLIDSISDPVPAGAGRIVEVRGRIVAAGAYANRSFYDEPKFTMVLTFMRNPDLGKVGAYPWVCDDADLTITELDRKSRR